MDAVVIATGPAPLLVDPACPGRVDVLTDRMEPPNIQRWWLAGITHAVGAGASAVVVCNDDVVAPPGSLLMLAEAVDAGADLAVVDPPWAPRLTPISGWAFALDPAQLLPDPAFQWWFGDDDLWMRSRHPVKVRCGATHLRVGGDYDRDGLDPLTAADRVLFRERWTGKTANHAIGAIPR
jgi:hypothetical protein